MRSQNKQMKIQLVGEVLKELNNSYLGNETWDLLLLDTQVSDNDRSSTSSLPHYFRT